MGQMARHDCRTGIIGAVVGMSPALAAVQRMGVFQVSRFLASSRRSWSVPEHARREAYPTGPKGPGVIGRARPPWRRYLF